MARCKICLRPAKGVSDLCKKHKEGYIYDYTLLGFRIKKTGNGSETRYTGDKYHSHEIELTKILEKYYGARNIVTGFRPIWAKSKKGALLEYDIYIRTKHILIEYNGIQHYEFTKIFHKTKKRFKEQQERDALKAKLAQEKGYRLVVIKYDEPLVEDYLIMKIGV